MPQSDDANNISFNNKNASLYRKPYVDIHKRPIPLQDYRINKGAQLTIGDLHGNALKLLYFLTKHGIFENIKNEDYQAFVAIYQKSTKALTAEDLQFFDTLLEKTKVNSQGTIRFLGDDLADRGANDYFTLKIFEKLSNEQVTFEIMLSNHTAEFLKAYERGKHYVSPVLGPAQAASMENMNTLLQKGLISKKEIEYLCAVKYLPHFKVLSYTLDTVANRIAIFSHAPIGLQTIISLAQHLSVPYNDDSLEDLAKTIDNINLTFYNQYAKTKQIHSVIKDSDICTDDEINVNDHPFVHIIWNRNYETLARPETHNGYYLKYVHGHDPSEFNQTHRIYNLDNYLGKGATLPTGPYDVHYTHETQLPSAQGQQKTPTDIPKPPPQQPQPTTIQKLLSTAKHPLTLSTLCGTAAAGICYLFPTAIILPLGLGSAGILATWKLKNVLRQRATQQVLQNDANEKTQAIQQLLVDYEPRVKPLTFAASLYPETDQENRPDNETPKNTKKNAVKFH